MHIRTLAVSAAALIASSGASLAQETMTDGLVMVNVAGSMVQVPVALAAEACGMDAAAVIAASDMMNTDAKGADMVAAEPNTGTAADTSTEPTTEAAVGTGAASTETEAGTVTETSTDTAAADAGMGTGTGTDTAGGTSTDTAAADAGTGANTAAEEFQVPEEASAGVAADLALEAEIANGGSETAAAGDAAAAADAGTEGAAGGEEAMAAAGGEPAMTGASAEEAMPTAVCEIDQATADQHGITAASETSGG